MTTTTMTIDVPYRYPPDWSMFTWKARILALSSGSISILFSALVISIIWRSEKGFSSPYHRIILFMCFWDIVSSSAIVLTVIPMPADVHDIYDFSGKAYGNKATCEAQAFAIVVGQAFAVCANCVLNIYYLCTLRYGTSQEKLNTLVLPIALAVSCLIVFPIGFVPLFFGLLNPRPHEPYCLIGSYPEDCNLLDDIECISKTMSPYTEHLLVCLNTALIGFAFISVIVSLLLVVIAVFKSEMTALEIRKDSEKNSHTETECEECTDEQQDDDQLEISHVTSLKGFRETLMCGRVALMYIAAFFITWIWTVLSLLGGKLWDFEQGTWDVIGDAKLVCLPLQGCINSLIFIYHKAQIIRKRSPEKISFLEAIRRVIISPKTIPPERYVSSIEMIEEYILIREAKVNHREEMEAEYKHSEADLEIDIGCDEFESEKHFNLATDVSSAGIHESGVDKGEKCVDDLAPVIDFHRHDETPSTQSSDGISYDQSTQSWLEKHSLLSGFSDVSSIQKDDDTFI